MIKHSRHHNIDNAIVYGLAVISVLILSNIEKPIFYLQNKFIPKIITHQKIETANSSIFNKSAFNNIKIKGKAYVVYDIVAKEVISEKNGNVVLPIASITKVMTSVSARMHNDGNKNIKILSSSIDGAYDLGLKKDQVWTLNELLKYTLIFSSNDGAQAIADVLGGRNFFVSQMNSDALSLGLPLHFTHPAGLDVDGKIGGEGSALSVAKLVMIAHKLFPEIFDVTTKTRASMNSSSGRISGIPNTNQHVYSFRGIQLSKTGFTDDAGGNLVIIVDISIGHPVAIVVLGSTREERFSDVDILYKALQKSITK